MTTQIIVAIIGATVGVVGIASGVIQFALRSRDRRLEREYKSLDEYIINALPHFCGGRQERNAGISVIGHYWKLAPRLEGLFVRLLTGQGVYIIAEGKPEKGHEFCNFERIVRLLEAVPREDSAYEDEFNDLINELDRKKKEIVSKTEAGDSGEMRITIKQIDKWIKRLT